MTADCGCCSTPAPIRVSNRPGLSAIDYRLGTFATFRRDITDRLSQTMALAGLTARASDDYTLTAIELWSAVADVLTFYQERVANEAFLRTATQRDSLLRLVRLIDYELRPGAAATTQLAFTLEAGARTLIARGTRVQSIPGEGETPQKFETLEPLMADARLNRLRLWPLPSPDQPLKPGSEGEIAAPDAEALAAIVALAPGDLVVLYAPRDVEILSVREVRARDDTLVVGWRAPINGQSFTPAFDGRDETVRAYRLGRSFHLFGFDAPEKVVVAERRDIQDPTTTYLTEAETDYKIHADGTPLTQISLDGRYPGLKAGASLLVVALFDDGTTKATSAIPFEVRAVSERKAQRKAKTSAGTLVTSLSGTITQVELNASLDPNVDNKIVDDVREIVIHELIGRPLRFSPLAYAPTVGSSEVIMPGRRAGWSSVEVGRSIERGLMKSGVIMDLADFPTGRRVVLTDHTGAAIAATIVGASLHGNGVSFAPHEQSPDMVRDLGLAADQVTPVTVIVSSPLPELVSFSNPKRELTVTIGALPTQTIALDETIIGEGTREKIAEALQDAIRSALPGSPPFGKAMAWVPDDTSTFDPSDRIVVAPGVPRERIIFGPTADDPVTVLALGLDPAHVRFIDGLLSAPIARLNDLSEGQVRFTVGISEPQESAFLYIAWPDGAKRVAHDDVQATLKIPAIGTDDERMIVLAQIPRTEPWTFIRLSLRPDHPHSLDAATAALLGNVAPASHGESVRKEIVGDSDASLGFQRFALKKKPVTFVPSATPGGVSSSLTLRVNDVEWTEVPTLYGRSPNDHVYITRIRNDQTMTVEFGDGVTGARPETGRQNITATYRQGIGLAGRVGAGKLATLLDRPTGLKSVVNPTATDGGADVEAIDRARSAAPGTVRTFGRAVSLRDFEDTALLAGEVAKVSASFVWTGEQRAIHLTVAAQGGALFSAQGLRRLAEALAAERDPNRKLILDNNVRVPVRVDASIIVDDRYIAAQVLAAARSALLDALSFERRGFAEPVYLSDITRILQNVAGVTAVDVNVLDLKSEDPEFRAAHGVDDALGQPQPRLVMLPATYSKSSGKVFAAELAWIEIPADDVKLRVTGRLEE